MNCKILNSCKAKPSELGAKGFFYPKEDNVNFLFIQKGTDVQLLNFVTGIGDTNLQAIVVSNKQVEGSNSYDGVGVYWIEKKNVG